MPFINRSLRDSNSRPVGVALDSAGRFLGRDSTIFALASWKDSLMLKVFGEKLFMIGTKGALDQICNI